MVKAGLIVLVGQIWIWTIVVYNPPSNLDQASKPGVVSGVGQVGHCLRAQTSTWVADPWSSPLMGAAVPNAPSEGWQEHREIWLGFREIWLGSSGSRSRPGRVDGILACAAGTDIHHLLPPNQPLPGLFHTSTIPWSLPNGAPTAHDQGNQI